MFAQQVYPKHGSHLSSGKDFALIGMNISIYNLVGFIFALNHHISSRSRSVSPNCKFKLDNLITDDESEIRHVLKKFAVHSTLVQVDYLSW